MGSCSVSGHSGPLRCSAWHVPRGLRSARRWGAGSGRGPCPPSRPFSPSGTLASLGAISGMCRGAEAEPSRPSGQPRRRRRWLILLKQGPVLPEWTGGGWVSSQRDSGGGQASAATFSCRWYRCGLFFSRSPGWRVAHTPSLRCLGMLGLGVWPPSLLWFGLDTVALWAELAGPCSPPRR